MCRRDPHIALLVLLVGLAALIGGCSSDTEAPQSQPPLENSPPPETSPPLLTSPPPPPSPPAHTWAQPETGPGSANYSHSSFDRAEYGEGDEAYTVFTPADPEPPIAPLIIFNHGWNAMDPDTYGAWLAHLARRGNMIICPRWQKDTGDTEGSEFCENAATAVRDGIRRARSQRGVQPDPDRVAVLGHSVGGTITANMAADWNAYGIPRPRAAMCVEPGVFLANESGPWGVTISAYSKIAPDTLLIALSGSDDAMVGDEMATSIFQKATQVPPANKNYLIVHTDSHGARTLEANHAFPTCNPVHPRKLTALDYYALWKVFDGLTDAAFYGENREYALGNTPEQRYMGTWQDGTPIRELEVH